MIQFILVKNDDGTKSIERVESIRRVFQEETPSEGGNKKYRTVILFTNGDKVYTDMKLNDLVPLLIPNVSA